MTLTFVEPTTKQHFSGLLYGPEGCGKTVAATSAPAPNLYLNADAPSALRFARQKHPDKEIREVKVGNSEDVRARQILENAYFYAADQTNGVETVTLDSMGRIYDVVLQDLAKDDKHPTLPEHGDAGTFIERYVLALIELPVNVVLVAHDNPVEVAGSEADGTMTRELFPFVGTNKPGLAKKLMRPLDVVAYCGIAREGDTKRYVAQLFNGGGRRAKDRTGALGDSPETNLTNWAETIRTFYASQPAAEDKE